MPSSTRLELMVIIPNTPFMESLLLCKTTSVLLISAAAKAYSTSLLDRSSMVPFCAGGVESQLRIYVDEELSIIPKSNFCHFLLKRKWKNTKDCEKSTKGKYSKNVFQLLHSKRLCLPKLDTQL